MMPNLEFEEVQPWCEALKLTDTLEKTATKSYNVFSLEFTIIIISIRLLLPGGAGGFSQERKGGVHQYQSPIIAAYLICLVFGQVQRTCWWVIGLPGGSSPRPPFSRFARHAVEG
jgi:hypothetical protein